jgi:dCMP deaminase
MKQRFVDAYMDVAKRFSQLSYAVRLKVGAVIVKDDRIIAYGYNGTPSGWDNNCEDEVIVEMDEKFIKTLITKPEVLHAESNAIAKLAKSPESGDDTTLFITHSPCIECSKLIYQSGIKRVYFGEQYRNTDGIDFLKASKIDVVKVDKQSIAQEV